MATVDQPNSTQVDCIALVESEIAAARQERRPTSRQTLANLVVKRTGMPPKEALAIVEAFCEEREPAVPEFLESEFVIGWLKVIAVLQAIVGLVFFYYAKRAHESNQPIWIYLMLGTILLGFAVLSWVKSLEREYDSSKKS